MIKFFISESVLESCPDTLFCRKRVGGWATGGIPIFAVFLGVLGPLALSAHSIIKLPTFVFSLLARVDRSAQSSKFELKF